MIGGSSLITKTRNTVLIVHLKYSFTFDWITSPDTRCNNVIHLSNDFIALR